MPLHWTGSSNGRGVVARVGVRVDGRVAEGFSCRPGRALQPRPGRPPGLPSASANWLPLVHQSRYSPRNQRRSQSGGQHGSYGPRQTVGQLAGAAAGVAAIGHAAARILPSFRSQPGDPAKRIEGRALPSGGRSAVAAADLCGSRQARGPDRKGKRGDLHLCGNSGARGLTSVTPGGRCTIHAIPSSFAGSPHCAGRPKDSICVAVDRLFGKLF